MVPVQCLGSRLFGLFKNSCIAPTNNLLLLDYSNITPAPRTSTLCPMVTPALRHACTATDNGSSNEPSSKLTFSGSLSATNMY